MSDYIDNKIYSKIIVLGSTGSIGIQSLDVARKNNVKVVALSANSNYILLEKQAREFLPSFCAMANESAAAQLKIRLADTNINVYAGESGICEMIERCGDALLINAIIGKAGLMPTLEGIRNRNDIALANKESLVIAGNIVMAEAKKYGVKIYPVDSEHCAVYQCMRSGKSDEIKNLILTASGGPFFGCDKNYLSKITVDEALNHPTWKMGAKITIDSATMMNKGFEIIEAAHLFGIPADRIKVLVHRESIIHSMVEYIDNSVIAQLSVPDMRLCIQFAIFGGVRKSSPIDILELAKTGKLTFFEPDYETFPLPQYAIKAFMGGGALGAVLNAANEEAVESFLNRRIGFTDISDIVVSTLENLDNFKEYSTLKEILEADFAARDFAKKIISTIKRSDSI